MKLGIFTFLSSMRMENSRRIFLLSLIVVPVGFVFVVFSYLLYYVISMSCNSYKLGLHPLWIGLGNYREIITNYLFWHALANNAIYTGGVVGASFMLGLVMALLLQGNFRGQAILKILFTLPMLFIPASTAILWIFMYNVEFGVISQIYSFFRLPPGTWLASPHKALMAVMITDIWAWTSYMFLILYAGLQSLPKEPFEAATIDGASAFQRFRYITIPLMKSVIIIVLALKTIDVFRTFDYVWIMTRGGPGESSEILSTLIYRTAFLAFKYGKASAQVILALLITLPMTGLFVYALGRGRSRV